MPSTNKGFPYPSASDANNVPQDIQALADAVEAWPGIPSLTQTQINALSSAARTVNLHVYNSTTGKTQRWTGSTWVDLVEATGATFTGTVNVVSPTAAGSTGVRQITVSTSDPTGGSNGDIWLKYA